MGVCCYRGLYYSWRKKKRQGSFRKTPFFDPFFQPCIDPPKMIDFEGHFMRKWALLARISRFHAGFMRN